MKRRLNRFGRLIRTRPRLLIATSVGIAVVLLLPGSVSNHAITRGLIGWNAGTILYVVLAALMMNRSSDHQMRHRARLQDDGQSVILALVCLAAVASLAAIAGELAVVKEMHGLMKGAHVALAGTTVLSSWAFIQVMFALHYAHDYYAAVGHGRTPGLRFPDEEHPNYGDFFYFAAIIGTSGQTADVAFSSKPMRRVGSVHCILAYLFNTVVLALVINIGASLF
jgi:uncharacterized membrane protein